MFSNSNFGLKNLKKMLTNVGQSDRLIKSRKTDDTNPQGFQDIPVYGTGKKF